MRQLDRRGSITPAMLVVFAIVSFGFLGTWGLLHSWKLKARLQLALDECVREDSLALKRDLRRLGQLNTLIHTTRKSLTLGSLTPPSRAALQLALSGQVLAQEAVLGKWRLKQAAWIAGSGCSEAGRTLGIISPLACARGLPDLIGPQALHWHGRGSLRIRLQKSNRVSVAELRFANNSSEVPDVPGSAVWPKFHAHWCSDRKETLGASALGSDPLERVPGLRDPARDVPDPT